MVKATVRAKQRQLNTRELATVFGSSSCKQMVCKHTKSHHVCYNTFYAEHELTCVPNIMVSMYGLNNSYICAIPSALHSYSSPNDHPETEVFVVNPSKNGGLADGLQRAVLTEFWALNVVGIL